MMGRSVSKFDDDNDNDSDVNDDSNDNNNDNDNDNNNIIIIMTTIIIIIIIILSIKYEFLPEHKKLLPSWRIRSTLKVGQGWKFGNEALARPLK
jgi:hypothetical protein